MINFNIKIIKIKSRAMTASVQVTRHLIQMVMLRNSELRSRSKLLNNWPSFNDFHIKIHRFDISFPMNAK